MLIAFLFDTVGRYLRYRSQLASMVELDDRTPERHRPQPQRTESGGLTDGLALGAALIDVFFCTCKKARANAGLDLRQ
jgi:hypothetical protein